MPPKAAVPLIDRWQRLGKRQQLLAVIAGSVGTMLLMDLIALRPLRQHVQELNQKVSTAEQQLLQAIAAQHRADEVNKAFTAYAPYVHPAGSLESELAGFVGEVESALHQSGITVINFKPVTSRDEAPATVIRVAIEGESIPAQLMQFLSLVQRSTRVLKVTELSVRTTDIKTLRSSIVISKLLLK